MPLYEYRCQVCGESEEKIQSFSAPAEHDCPKCGAGAGMKRQLSAPAFNLAGGGWYANGYSGRGGESKTPAKDTAAPSGGCCGGGCACKTGS